MKKYIRLFSFVLAFVMVTATCLTFSGESAKSAAQLKKEENELIEL